MSTKGPFDQDSFSSLFFGEARKPKSFLETLVDMGSPRGLTMPVPSLPSSGLADLFGPPSTCSAIPGAFPAPLTPRAEISGPNLDLPALPRQVPRLRATSQLRPDLESDVKKIFRERWSKRDGQVVPEPVNLTLGNDAVELDATVLYADLSDSTKLVDSYSAQFAAEIYKTYLAAAARIVKHEGGTITAYDGDRVMAVFIGKSKNTSAVRAAFKINGAVWDIIKPSLKAQYPSAAYDLKHVVGIDTSKLFVSRIGVRNDNDLVWVGRAANYAAKLSSLSNEFAIYVTYSIYDNMHESVKLSGNHANMWQERVWTTMGNMRIYGTTWKFGV